LGIDQSNTNQIKEGISKVWASIFNYRALISRRKAGINSHFAKMGVLVQEMINPDCAFIIHTTNPINRDNNQVYIEIAHGLGETLASANQRGSPYRLIYYKDSSAIEVLSFSSYSYAIKDTDNGLANILISYKNDKLSSDIKYLIAIGTKLGQIGMYLEENVSSSPQPQDIEGAIISDEIYVVQTRPQMV
jgi:phosphoglucan,water dikinase